MVFLWFSYGFPPFSHLSMMKQNGIPHDLGDDTSKQLQGKGPLPSFKLLYKPHEYYSYLRTINHSEMGVMFTNLAIERGATL